MVKYLKEQVAERNKRTVHAFKHRSGNGFQDTNTVTNRWRLQ